MTIILPNRFRCFTNTPACRAAALAKADAPACRVVALCEDFRDERGRRGRRHRLGNGQRGRDRKHPWCDWRHGTPAGNFLTWLLYLYRLGYLHPAPNVADEPPGKAI